MASYIAPSGEPLCAECKYSLRGSPNKGRCPECGCFYYLSKPQPAPTFRRRLVRLRDAALQSLTLPTFRSLAITLLIVGSAILVIAFGYLAIDPFYGGNLLRYLLR